MHNTLRITKRLYSMGFVLLRSIKQLIAIAQVKESNIMSNNNNYDISDSKDCKTYINQFIQEFTIRSAEIGKGTIIKRALPTDVCQA